MKLGRDWRNPDDYEFPDDWEPERWAWESLRRNEEYGEEFRRAAELYLASGGQELPGDGDPEDPRFIVPPDFCMRNDLPDPAAKWLIHAYVNPRQDQTGAMILAVSDSRFRIRVLSGVAPQEPKDKILDLRWIETPLSPREVAVVFDLAQPSSHSGSTTAAVS